MKGIILIFAVISAIFAQDPPPSVDNLFATSWDMQQRLSPRQQVVDSEVTELRESLTDVLEVRTAGALEGIENNTRQIIELERPYRVMLTSLPESSCRNNLLTRLSLETDFSGFRSSLCVRTYDESSGVVVQEAQDFIAMYEGLFVRLQKVVVYSYERRNPFSQQAEIVDRFNDEYNRRLQEWDAIRPQAEDFEVTIDRAMETTEEAMEECMLTARNIAVQNYQEIISQISVCEGFDP